MVVGRYKKSPRSKTHQKLKAVVEKAQCSTLILPKQFVANKLRFKDTKNSPYYAATKMKNVSWS